MGPPFRKFLDPPLHLLQAATLGTRRPIGKMPHQFIRYKFRRIYVLNMTDTIYNMSQFRAVVVTSSCVTIVTVTTDFKTKESNDSWLRAGCMNDT